MPKNPQHANTIAVAPPGSPAPLDQEYLNALFANVGTHGCVPPLDPPGSKPNRGANQEPTASPQEGTPRENTRRHPAPAAGNPTPTTSQAHPRSVSATAYTTRSSNRDLAPIASVHHGNDTSSYGLETTIGVEDGPFRIEGDELMTWVEESGTNAPYFPVPAALREALVGWRTALGEVPGFMALAQYLLFAAMRTEHGVVFPYEVVYRAFGTTYDRARNEGVYTEPLLDLYAARVDASLTYKDRWYQRGLARTITHTGFPEDVVEIARQYKVAPDSFDTASGQGGYVYLIDGSSANRRNTQARTNRERLDDAMINDPAVPMPRSAEIIQAYLNLSLDDALFTNGRYGLVAKVPDCVARVQQMAADGEHPFDTEGKADCALRQLAWMQAYPRPFYKPCDHSPRLRADHYNQLMNVPSGLRPTLYNDRDVELDLDKAHMASLVVVARKQGLSMPLLSQALQDATRDIWTEFADRFDAEALPTAKACRKAAKSSYAAVFGSSENNLLREISMTYSDVGGRTEGTISFEPFRPIMEHPLMAEIYETAQAVLDHIEAAGGLHDAEGRWIELEAFGAKKPEDRAKTLLAYVCASYEQVLIAEAFRVATDEIETPTCYGRPAFQIWLYQADGFTLRLSGKANGQHEVDRLQYAVAEKAAALGMPTSLSVS